MAGNLAEATPKFRRKLGTASIHHILLDGHYKQTIHDIFFFLNQNLWSLKSQSKNTDSMSSGLMISSNMIRFTHVWCILNTVFHHEKISTCLWSNQSLFLIVKCQIWLSTTPYLTAMILETANPSRFCNLAMHVDER